MDVDSSRVCDVIMSHVVFEELLSTARLVATSRHNSLL